VLALPVQCTILPNGYYTLALLPCQEQTTKKPSGAKAEEVRGRFFWEIERQTVLSSQIGTARLAGATCSVWQRLRFGTRLGLVGACAGHVDGFGADGVAGRGVADGDRAGEHAGGVGLKVTTMEQDSGIRRGKLL
jgi:hypothetical protein